jgi:hypothetical protein
VVSDMTFTIIMKSKASKFYSYLRIYMDMPWMGHQRAIWQQEESSLKPATTALLRQHNFERKAEVTIFNCP